MSTSGGAAGEHREIEGGDGIQAPATEHAGNPATAGDVAAEQRHGSLRSSKPRLARNDTLPRPFVNFADDMRSPTSSTEGQLSPSTAADDRVFPVRSVISVDPTSTPAIRSDRFEGYFSGVAHARRTSVSTSDSQTSTVTTPGRNRQASSATRPLSPLYAQDDTDTNTSRDSSAVTTPLERARYPNTARQPPQVFNDIIAETGSVGSAGDARSNAASERFDIEATPSIRSARSVADDGGGLITARFKHVVTEGGHAIITGRDGDVLQRCEDEPIHIPGAVQGFGLLIALQEEHEGKLVVRVVSENSRRIIGFTPRQLFALESFTDILSEDQAENLLDHVDFIRDEDADVATNGPEVFTMSIRTPQRKNQKLWCAMHVNDRNPDLIICEFELEDDPFNPLTPANEGTPEPPEDTLNSQPTDEEFAESTQNSSKPLRVLRSARKRKGEAAAMEVFNIMSQVQEQLAAAPNLERFLKILVGVVKELTGFHRVMIYQFDNAWNGRVVTELVDPRATKDLYKGLNFPASDIPKQARDLYKINKVRMLYDRDQETARLVCRTLEDLETPLDLTYSYLRAMSPIHLKYLANMAVRSSMSISINAFDELWGLIACHTYGTKGMRVSFPIRKMCRLVGDSASRNIERLSYASRLQARKLINTVPTANNPSGYIIASSEDLLKLFDADFGLLSIRDETKILGNLEQSQEALAMLEYLRMRSFINVMTSMDITEDFPDLRYPPGFKVLAGLLLVPLSVGGNDFIVFFRKGQMKEVKWAGNPYEKFIKEGTEGYLEPRKSFRTWSETVVGKCREWTEEEIETAAVLCLVYGKFIEVWRQKEAALQNSQLTRLLLANSAHEVRTPLNAIINYLEIALEGSLDQETRDNLAKSHSASKSLIYVINDLLDLTKTEEGGELVKDEIFELRATLFEATDMFKGDARRKNITYEVIDHPDLPVHVIGDQRRVRQAISNVTANAIKHTTEGDVRVEMYATSRESSRVEVEISITDTGAGMNAKKLDALFRELEQVQTAPDDSLTDPLMGNNTLPDTPAEGSSRTLGLGLAVVARIVRNMNGQLRLRSEEGKGSRFTIQFPFELPDSELKQRQVEIGSSAGSITPHAEVTASLRSPQLGDEVTLIRKVSYPGRESDSLAGTSLSRRNSSGSTNSRKSLNSMRSAQSNLSRTSGQSGKSEADRLIEAIQEPHRVEGWSDIRGGRSTSRRSVSSPSARPPLQKRHTAPVDDESLAVAGSPRPASTELAAPIVDRQQLHKPGEAFVVDQGTPIRPIRVPDDIVITPGGTAHPVHASAGLTSRGSISHEQGHQKTSQVPEKPLTTEEMRVLVAEDDPVNSRIIKKRLEKLGHDVHLTVNGEECSSAYCDKPGFFDIVLMDMQMPIVDGLTAAKMIRSYEKSHPQHILSTRASLNGRVPIIAVSASLVEKDRGTYIEGGFDGWILKPISFTRLSEIMFGTVNKDVRRNNLYQNGRWEHGGWFSEADSSIFDATTKPSDKAAVTRPDFGAASDGVAIAASSDDPFVKEDSDSRQTLEQQRLLRDQEGVDASAREQTRGPKSYSVPDLTSREFVPGQAPEFTPVIDPTSEQVHSPPALTPSHEQPDPEQTPDP